MREEGMLLKMWSKVDQENLKKKIQLVIGASSCFISDYMLYHRQQQVLLTRVGNTALIKNNMH